MDPENISILVVDDYTTMRRIIRNILMEAGYRSIYEAQDGKAALNLLRSENIDLVISDWNMPRMSGLELLKEIRADEKINHTPVLMLTAEADKPHVISAAQAGVNGYIVKPFEGKTVVKKVEKLLQPKVV